MKQIRKTHIRKNSSFGTIDLLNLYKNFKNYLSHEYYFGLVSA